MQPKTAIQLPQGSHLPAAASGRGVRRRHRRGPGGYLRVRGVAGRIGPISDRWSVDRHAGPQTAGQRIGPVERDLHRDALHDLGEVAGGVVRRQQREFLAAGRREAVDVAAHAGAGERVDLDLDRLAGMRRR